jgi:hypothetical protein
MARPKYRLTEKAYIDDRLLDPESMPLMATKDDDVFDENATPERKPLIIEYDGIPGPHMVPLNKEAEAMVAKYPNQANMDPIAALQVAPSAAMAPPTPAKVVGAKTK